MTHASVLFWFSTKIVLIRKINKISRNEVAERETNEVINLYMLSTLQKHH